MIARSLAPIQKEVLSSYRMISDYADGNASSVVIVGAGPAGLTAAYELSKAGVPVTVLEKDTQVGGLAKTILFKGWRLDLGPHRFFTKLAEVNRIWQEVLGEDAMMIKRLTRIYYRNRFFFYPLRPANAFLSLGPWLSLKAFVSFVRARLRPVPEEKTFEDWVSNRFGRTLYTMFFKTYTEKVWGIPCAEIEAEWAAQRIKGLSLLEAVRNAFGFGQKGRVKSLVDEFSYPKKGTGMFYEKMQKAVEQKGSRLSFGREVTALHHKGGRITRVVTRNAEGLEETWPATDVITSLPLTLLIQRLNPPPPPDILEASRQLTFRSTILVYLVIQGENLFPDNWIYVHAPEVQMGRITNFRNWSPEMTVPGQTVLCVEYWCFPSDSFWNQSDADLQAMAAHDLQTIHLFKPAPVLDGFCIKIPRTYPVYRMGYRRYLDPLVAYLKTFANLQPIGRFGAFKYNNQDHSILMGMLAARNLLGESHDLWSVNSDSEYQEEIQPLPYGAVIEEVIMRDHVTAHPASAEASGPTLPGPSTANPNRR